MVAIEAPTTADRKPRLTRELIVEATRQILDERGLDALSMRVVAESVGSSPMALYRHIADRHELEIAVARQVSAELELADDPDVEPHAAIGSWMRAVRAHWLRHPWFGQLVRAHAELADQAAAMGAVLAGALERAGAEPRVVGEEIIHITRTTIGVVLVEQSAPLAQRAESSAWRIGEESGSAVARAAGSLDDDQLFELVIRSTLAGLDARLDDAPDGGTGPDQGDVHGHD